MWKHLWLLLCLVFAMAACSPSQTATLAEPPTEPSKPVADPKPVITLGAKSLTEQYLLMKMTSLLLKEQGYKVKEIVFLDSPAIRQAMESGVIDLYWEYTTTALHFYHKRPPIYDPDESFAAAAKADKPKGIIWIERSQFDSSWAVLMKRSVTEQLHISTISDLAAYAREKQHKFKFATNDEYLIRDDGIKRLQEVYQFSISDDDLIAIDSSLLPQAVKESRVQVAVGMATDPRIQEDGLVILHDDKKLFAPYHASAVIQEKTLHANRDIEKLMKQLTKPINNETMDKLIYQVDVLHQDVSQTARQFLIQQKLIQSQPTE
ncbi:glycine betaine ABC transporter substrate-binding protein [Brevibacillus sp. B_LB10_24]|uniref:ABC transporter substrate-binding protein n=1 Tax=Brevibacillus sp. B_LB10_24 TaxID=3380645 RepID=UPI0038B6DEB1